MPRYTLTRKGDGSGDTGTLTRISKSGLKYDGWPEVGEVVQVGANRTTMFGSDTWWRTTPITEIVSRDKDEIVFRTTNSTYSLRRV